MFNLNWESNHNKKSNYFAVKFNKKRKPPLAILARTFANFQLPINLNRSRNDRTLVFEKNKKKTKRYKHVS